jgi:hypothetical protein
LPDVLETRSATGQAEYELQAVLGAEEVARGNHTLIILRETPHGMLVELRTIILALAASALYALVSVRFSLDEPSLRLLWVIGTLFLMFYLLSANQRDTDLHGVAILSAIAIFLLYRLK